MKPEDTATSLIREVYENSLNLGTSSTGTLMQLAVIKEYLGELRPKAVLWFLYEANDLQELQSEYYKNPLARKYLGTDYRQDLLSRQEDIDQAKKSLSNALLALYGGRNETLDSIRGRLTLQFIRKEVVSTIRKRLDNGLSRNRHGGQCPTESIMPLFDEVLKDGRDFVASWGGSVYLVYLPSWTRYADPGEACVDQRGDRFLHDQALSVARNAGVQVIDATPAFDAHPDPLSLFPFRQYGHYNEAGYRVVADAILRSPELKSQLSSQH